MHIMSLYFWKDQRFIYVYDTKMYIIEIRLKNLKLYAKILALIFGGWYEIRNGEGNGNLLQHSCLENPMDGGAWWAAVHGVEKSWTQLSDLTFTFHFHALEKEMATHSSVLAWRISGTAEPSGLPSMGSHRVGHNWSDSAAAAAWNQEISILFFPFSL